ncbi:MAG: glucosamine-6-phosphate deaminase [Oscillospiraceae bacterium]|nr:glucosamine-6-phosphate deaminase [Oscillospiraceae bacterium]
MIIKTVRNYEKLSEAAAIIIASQVIRKPDSVLGLATGSTPAGTYAMLVKMHKEGLLDFSRITTFNLDEYCGISSSNPQSYNYYMQEHLFSHINIPDGNIHIPDGMAKNPGEECENYEKKLAEAGGVDLQILGVGQNGHVGFNEPGGEFSERTCVVKLSQSTIDANSRFFSSPGEVPKTALSMGIQTILSAKEILLIAGNDKSDVIRKLKKGGITSGFPVSILRYHPNCSVIYAEN